MQWHKVRNTQYPRAHPIAAAAAAAAAITTAAATTTTTIINIFTIINIII